MKKNEMMPFAETGDHHFEWNKPNPKNQISLLFTHMCRFTMTNINNNNSI
jgi:hypothetical protein